MSEEVLKIGMITGITCKDGRNYQELACIDKDGNEVRVVVPVSHTCGETVNCDSCPKQETCEMQDQYENDIGRSMIIKRI